MLPISGIRLNGEMLSRSPRTNKPDGPGRGHHSAQVRVCLVPLEKRAKEQQTSRSRFVNRNCSTDSTASIRSAGRHAFHNFSHFRKSWWVHGFVRRSLGRISTRWLSFKTSGRKCSLAWFWINELPADL
uniref:(northern house mosquito) hypothetical protein n=1 Tax=Culex pipiens TaxID=7175 RepID=A0A8D8CG20_CULPI